MPVRSVHKIAVILNGASARALAAGRCAVKDPVEWNVDVRPSAVLSRDASTPFRPACAHDGTPLPMNLSQKNEVILNGASARALSVGRRAVKNPVECNAVARTSVFQSTGFFDSVPPRLRPRGTPLRMTSIFDGEVLFGRVSREND